MSKIKKLIRGVLIFGMILWGSTLLLIKLGMWDKFKNYVFLGCVLGLIILMVLPVREPMEIEE